MVCAKRVNMFVEGGGEGQGRTEKDRGGQRRARVLTNALSIVSYKGWKVKSECVTFRIL